MRVLIDASCLGGPRTGVGRYALNILRRLPDRLPDADIRYFDGIGGRDKPPDPAAGGEEGLLRRTLRAMPGTRPLWRRLRAELWRRAGGGSGDGPDIAFAPNFRPPRIERFCVPVIHDLAFIRHPETLPRDRRVWLEGVAPQLAAAPRVIAVSPFTAREIAVHFGLAAERIWVATPAAEERFRRQGPPGAEEPAPFGLTPGGYFLAVGTLEPRKNLGLLVEAYARLPAPLRARVPLVLAGPRGWGEWDGGGRARALIAAGRLRLPAYVPDAALPSLYAGAVALCMPSVYEGFGLPVIEALSTGTPALVSAAGALPETAGPGGIALPPDHVEAWTDAMIRLYEDGDLRLTLSRRGRDHAREYDWDRSTDITAAALREACGLGTITP